MKGIGRLRGIASLVLLAMATGAVAIDAPRSQPSDYMRAPFGDVAVQRPVGEPKGTIIFLSDGDGWSSGETEMARRLAGQGLLVAGVSTPALARAMESNGAKCVDPNYPLIDLARDVQHRMGVATYRKPIIIGYGSGAAMAYAALSQWPNGGYQGVVSIDFLPSLPGRKPWCGSPGFVTHHVGRPKAAWRFPPNGRIKVPWIVLQRRAGSAFPLSATQRFVSAIPGARLIQLPGVESGDAGPARWTSQILGATMQLLPPPLPRAAPGETPIPDMPLTLVSATRRGVNGDTMAILYSGDGGWVGIDRDVAGQLAAAGIPVVGVDSLSYFWSARTPRGTGRDLSQLITGFSQRWNRPRVMLIGYSFGADAMPYMIQNLDAPARARVRNVALMGFGSTAEFQFHMTSWLNIASDDALPTIPAVTKLKGMTIRCVRGTVESDSACLSIPKGLAQQYFVPGDHHFNRNAWLLARILLGQRRAGFVTR